MQGDVVLADWGICGHIPINTNESDKQPNEASEVHVEDTSHSMKHVAASRSAMDRATGTGNASSAGVVVLANDPCHPKEEQSNGPAVAFIRGAPMGTPFWAAPELDVGAPHDQ